MALSERGFTLVEIALVLVVVGLLVGISAPMIKIMSQRAKHLEAGRILQSSRESLAGYALVQRRLPAWGDNAPDAVAVDEFCEVVSQRSDAWAQPLRYIYDNRPTADLCSQTTGLLTVVPVSEPAVSNVAFVVLSSGANYAFEAGLPASGGINAPATITLAGDDLCVYMSIYELQALAGCSPVDRCAAAGISVMNQSAGALSYRVNGGACSAWNSGAAVTVLPSSMLDVHVGAGCSSVTATYLTYTQQKKDFDLDHDCLTAISYSQAASQFPMYDR